MKGVAKAENDPFIYRQRAPLLIIYVQEPLICPLLRHVEASGGLHEIGNVILIPVHPELPLAVDDLVDSGAADAVDSCHQRKGVLAPIGGAYFCPALGLVFQPALVFPSKRHTALWDGL